MSGVIEHAHELFETGFLAFFASIGFAELFGCQFRDLIDGLVVLCFNEGDNVGLARRSGLFLMRLFSGKD